MIFLGADHRGYDLKEKIKIYLEQKQIAYQDLGTNSKEIAHFPLIAKSVCEKMDVQNDIAILICGSGIGMTMAANKFRGIRAGVCMNEEMAMDGKEHSNINVLVLPGNFIDIDNAIKIIDVWLNSKFLNGRYLDRLNMIEQIEKENMK